MLPETEFHAHADTMLTALMDALEEADARGALDTELEGGILTVTLSSGKHYLVSKHTASRELWVSSPLTGGLHFARAGDGWKTADGKELEDTVLREISQLAGVVF